MFPLTPSGRSVSTTRRGHFQKNAFDAYSLNSVTAKKHTDGSVAVQFGGCDDHAGQEGMVRLYRPRPEILDGSWKFPDAEPAS
jgi:hypothetical protein